MINIFSFVYDRIPEFIEINEQDLSSIAVNNFMRGIILKWFLMVLPFFIFGVAITLLISIIQVGWKVTAKSMQPKLSKFNPINGFKRMFSKDSLFELFKSIFKIGIIAYVAYTAVKDHENDIFILYDIPLNRALLLVGDIIINTGLKISIVYLVVGIADFVYNKHKFNEDMKMTKQEVKDEDRKSVV